MNDVNVEKFTMKKVCMDVETILLITAHLEAHHAEGYPRILTIQNPDLVLAEVSLHIHRQALDTHQQALDTHRQALDTHRQALDTHRQALDTYRQALVPALIA